ncbi:MAG: hypothetical protein OJF49_002120 [Ktedonobacterales bacterium]|nr:MAG: hypothetical protein OJF49_002120 [Ktedonobacterales bacterium]
MAKNIVVGAGGGAWVCAGICLLTATSPAPSSFAPPHHQHAVF